MLQTLHKLYTNPTLRRFKPLHSERSKPYTASVQNPTQRAFRPLHSERSQNYTRSGTQTIHSVFEHESREWNLESVWSESYVTFVTYVTYVKQEMAIGGDALRHSFRLFLSLTLCLFLSPSRLLVTLSRRFVTPARRPKIQQFRVIFRRFDINIFNLSEHFPPPNFANSACSFALPSPNLN